MAMHRYIVYNASRALSEMSVLRMSPRDQSFEFLHYEADSVSGAFKANQFQSILRTRSLGHNLLYSPTISSTQTPSFFARVCCISNRRTSIWQRARRQYLDFSTRLPDVLLYFSDMPKSKASVSSGVPTAQYLVSLALIDAVLDLPLPSLVSKRLRDQLRIKWPNDIYTDTCLKVGGILCQTSCIANNFDLLIGVGFNVTNSAPTTCLNDLLQTLLPEPDPLVVITREALLAAFLLRFETYMAEFELTGFETFLPSYLASWLHSHQVVTLEGGARARIIGLSDDGFLRAVDEDALVGSREERELHPDGNSLDFLSGLVTRKIERRPDQEV